MAKSRSRMLSGSPLLIGDSNVPGVPIHKEFLEVIDRVFKECREFGLDFYPTIIQFLTYDEMSEIASYGGFPRRYPHWSFGAEYEELSRGYEYGMHRISEMVVNCCPCVIYFLDSNSLVDNIDVLCHALGHNDFFKNNEFFRGTNTDMMSKFANHGTRIRRYMRTWGKEKVTAFIDHVRRIDSLIDPSKEWRPTPAGKQVFYDERVLEQPKRRKAHSPYMDDWVNDRGYMQKEKERVHRKDISKELELFDGPEKDVLRFLRDHAPLKPWQQDIIAMLYEEATYFAPQRLTKRINEGYASYVDHHMMTQQGLCALGQKRHDMGIFTYAEHKMRVLGGQWSNNPYKFGFELLMDIEDRWNKGRFGREWEECEDMHTKKTWDKKLGQGKDKVFQVRQYCNDFTLVAEYFTPEFCEKQQYYDKKRFPNGEHKLMSRDFKVIKKRLMQDCVNGGLPDIRLVDPNHRNKGWFLMQHMHDGQPLYDSYARDTMTSIWRIWKNTAILASKDDEGGEFVYICTGKDPKKDVVTMHRRDYEKDYK